MTGWLVTQKIFNFKVILVFEPATGDVTVKCWGANAESIQLSGGKQHSANSL